MSTLQLITEAATAVSSSDGILDLTNDKMAEGILTVENAARLICAAFIAYIAVKSHFAGVRILMATLIAGLVLWVVNNVTEVEERVGNEFDSAPASIQLPQQL